jgi:ssRNA-specific RNase YbeY (16S rRNA maturation enzyme)
LLIHGILHLLGYDHEVSRGEAVRMHRKERELKALLPTARDSQNSSESQQPPASTVLSVKSNS